MPRPKRDVPPRITDEELDSRFLPMVNHAISRHNYHAGIAKLEKELGVPSWTVATTKVAWYPQYRAWGFPETTAAGLVTGISLRSRGGQRRCVLGSRRGLFGVAARKKKASILYLVEGATDVLAGLAVGLQVIGFPGAAFQPAGKLSRSGRLIADLLRGEPLGLRLVIIGENDQRVATGPHVTCPGLKCPGCAQCWPGLVHNVALRDSLRKYVRQSVDMVLLDEVKDLRAWYLRYRSAGHVALRSVWDESKHEQVPWGGNE